MKQRSMTWLVLTAGCLLPLSLVLSGCGKNEPESKQVATVDQPKPPEALASKPGIDMKAVRAEGYGRNFDEALQQALVMAIKQVNGVTASQSVDTKNIVSEFHAKSSSSGELNASASASSNSDSHLNASMRSNADTRNASLQSSISEKSDARQQAIYSESSAEEGKFDSGQTVVSMSLGVSGVVRRFQVSSATQSQDKSSWTVAIVAEIPVYAASTASKRLSVAVLPFRIESKGAEGAEYERVVRPMLVDALSQSNKLAVLDRDYQSENQGEIEQLRGEDFNKDQAARLGNRLGADYIIVGSITKATVFTETKTIKSANRTIYGATHADASMTFRLIEAATGVVQLSATLDGTRYKASLLNDLAKGQAADLAERVLESLFPIRVEGYSNGEVYLGRGGDSIKVGQVFEVFRRGDAIKDSDTGEIIGHSEENLGIVEVIEVQAKISKATFVGAPPADMSNPKSIVVRKGPAVAASAVGAASVKVGATTAAASASASVTIQTNQEEGPQSSLPPPVPAQSGPKEGIDF